MTDDYHIDINQVEQQFNEQLEGFTLHVTSKDPGDGEKFAIELYETGSSTVLLQSYYYEKEQFKAFCAGMKQLGAFIKKAQNERQR